MSRYVGAKNNNIYVVSDNDFSSDELNITKITDDFKNITSNDLIVNYIVKDGQVKLKKNFGPAKTLKVAFVSNWKMRCGISTYAEFLYTEIMKYVGDYKFFIEKNNMPTGPLGIPDDKIVSCWKRGESLKELVKEIKEYNPDVILIQHEFGIWPNARYWLSMMSQLSQFRTIVTMHSVFHHKDKIISEAAMPEIVVHLPGAVNVLKEEKGISSKVHLIPHGCYEYNGEKLWNFYKSDHTIIQVGFLFRYKGWQESLKTISILKEKYPDVFFTGICSESQYAKVEHQLYYNELMDLVDKLGLQENVSLIRGFQSDNVLDSFFRTNRIALFPYISHPEHEVFGASGAARLAMSKGLPVISSFVNHFQDLPTIKANTPEDMAQEIDKLFSDNKLYTAQLSKQIEFINNNNWESVAKQYINIIENE